jgi:hypothetical protein
MLLNWFQKRGNPRFFIVAILEFRFDGRAVRLAHPTNYSRETSSEARVLETPRVPCRTVFLRRTNRSFRAAV